MEYVKWFDKITLKDLAEVGGKNGSLGEMISSLKKEEIAIPEGFATTASAYFDFIKTNRLEEKIGALLNQFPQAPLEKIGKEIRQLILEGTFSLAFTEAIKSAYQTLNKRYHSRGVDVAVRSSATAEDLPEASFAGQQESFLNVKGFDNLLDACRKCYASLFTNRAITYRNLQGFDHLKIALSVGVQKMVRSDKAGAGVIFTLDTETGFRNMIVINAAWGLGENVVQGAVIPDEYRVFKPLMSILEKVKGSKEKKMIYSKAGVTNRATPPLQRKQFVLTDEEIRKLAQWALLIENHYQKPMDIEWAKDGVTEELFIVQARPETVQTQKKAHTFKTYSLQEQGKLLTEGVAIGDAIVLGKAQIIKNVSEIAQFVEGSILITRMTSPDWVPIMQKAKGIITDQGGRTSHAAIVSRELGLPAIVGTHNATSSISEAQEITLCCAEGERGHVYEGYLKYAEKEIDLETLPTLATQIMLNIASPSEAMRWWQLPVQGVGLARMEFIINNAIKIHPMALVHLDKVSNRKERALIQKMTREYKDKGEYFVHHLSQGIAQIAASCYPHPAIVRLSDFKTNEYANLIGGKDFEPKEENPMLGFRGACRYYHEKYREGFSLECLSIKRVREEMGLKNLIIMIPFCRTLKEADLVLQALEHNGLKRGEKGLEVYVMCEIPSNVILAEQFSQKFDGFSIGSNDLTQLILGVDRDSSELAPLFDERDEAVKSMISQLIQVAKKQKRKVGICGQAPSDYPEFAHFLIQAGIDSLSLNPNSVINLIKTLSRKPFA